MRRTQQRPRDTRDVETTPAQLDPLVKDERASPVAITAAILAMIAILIVVFYGLSRPPGEPGAAPVAAGPPAQPAPANTGKNGAGTSGGPASTTGQGSANANRPNPAEQDPLEQNTRP